MDPYYQWQQPWYPSPPGAQTYLPNPYPSVPPGYWTQPPNGAWNQPAPNPTANAPRSRKYPSLNPILASDTTLIRYDIRKEPSSSILASTFTQYRNERAISNPTNHLRLVCKDFPWVIEIKLPTGGLLTCEHVWQAIYNALQVDIVDSEWGILVVCGGNNQEDRRKGMLKAAKKRGDNSGGPVKMKRIDWLGDKTMFKGLDRDDGFAEKMIMPGTDRCDETWVIKLGDR